jgi:hypothetical protein
MKRRTFLHAAILAAVPRTDARIDEVITSFRYYLYRAPYKFGGKEVARVTLLRYAGLGVRSRDR